MQVDCVKQTWGLMHATVFWILVVQICITELIEFNLSGLTWGHAVWYVSSQGYIMGAVSHRSNRIWCYNILHGVMSTHKKTMCFIHRPYTKCKGSIVKRVIYYLADEVNWFPWIAPYTALWNKLVLINTSNRQKSKNTGWQQHMNVLEVEGG